MIDLETLSTDPRAVILSVGACKFTETTIVDTFYREVEIQPQFKNRHISAETLKWWLSQGEEAQRVFGDADKASLAHVLADLTIFVGADAPTIHTWANGASFDLPILATAYTDAGGPVPWRFYNERCYRTVKNLFDGQYKKLELGQELKHNALNDAVFQARQLMEIMQCHAFQ
jgi:exodeoxyribonuclease VIII